jgi:hypothetical protein
MAVQFGSSQPRHFAVKIAVRVACGPIALRAEPIEESKETGIIFLELDRRQGLNSRAMILWSEKLHADASYGLLLRTPRSLAGGGGVRVR